MLDSNRKSMNERDDCLFDSESKDITIIGGGIIGLSCAYYLSNSGYSVRVIEQGNIANGSSRENCGLISPSHALPLPQPGLILKAMKMMVKKDSPLYINPIMDWATLTWFVKTAGQCNNASMKRAMLGRQQLLDESRPMWNEWAEIDGFDIEFEEKGCIQVHATKSDFNKFIPLQRMLDDINLVGREFIGEELLELEPGLKSGLYGGWFYDIDAQMRPENIMIGMRNHVESSGVEILENCQVESFESKQNKITSVKTSNGEYSSENYVLATGSWTPKLGKRLGIKIPIQPGKGYSITLERPEGCVDTPLILSESSMAVTPWKSGLRLGGTMEFSGLNKKINHSRIEALKRGAKRYLRAPGERLIQDKWYGWRPMTPDGMPIIDYSPKHDNLIIAAGHNMQGMSMAPQTGKLVSDMVEGISSDFDLSYYSANRF